MSKKIMVLCFALLTSGSLFAKNYDLESYLAQVRKNSKDLKLAEKELDLAEAMKKEAWATALPKVAAQGNYNRNLLDNYLFVDFPGMGKQKFKISYNNEFAFNTALQQPIFSFKIGNALTAAKQYEKLTEYAFDASEQGIITFAKKGFYQALLLKKVWEVSGKSERSAKNNYDNVKKKFDNGQVSEFELLQAEVTWKNHIPETMAAKRNYELLVLNLKNFAGIGSSEEMELAGTLDTFPSKPELPEPKDVFDQRPDFQAIVWQKKLLETNLRATKSDYYPSLDGSFVYTFSAQSNIWRMENRNNNFILGVQLSIPIYTGGYTGAQVQKAKVELEKSKINIDKTEENIANELSNIKLRLDEADQRIQSAKGTLSTAEKAFKIAEVSAQNGLITQLELKDARLFFDQATLNFYLAVYDYLDAYFDWEKAAGIVE